MRGGAGAVRHRVRERGEQGVVLRCAGHQQPHAGQVEAVEQRQVGPLGDEDPALGVQDVAGEFRAPAGGVDPGDGGSREGRGTQPHRVLGGVVEQDTDVRLGAGRQQVGQQGRPDGGPGRHLVLRQHPPLEPQPRPVVTPPGAYELGDRTWCGLRGLHERAR
ncbi:hypothetical protein AQI70_31560 [Streptomyces curacoi]|uniref:Uncharacterized protein n=1 Tax=Streptomyces curacoi TaxID=146536 RepID=A0A124GVY1_9ACTN|nr:hypothetical protein AQI70_31560 [Streptomyces curacoi]